jgi:hypothetical protein
VPRSGRLVAGAASFYCLVVGLACAAGRVGGLDLVWTLAAIFAALTLVPQLFRRRRGFWVACWVSAVLVGLFGLFGFMFGGLLFLPAILPLLVAGGVPAGFARLRERPHGMARAGVVIGLVIVLVAYAALVLSGG